MGQSNHGNWLLISWLSILIINILSEKEKKQDLLFRVKLQLIKLTPSLAIALVVGFLTLSTIFSEDLSGGSCSCCSSCCYNGKVKSTPSLDLALGVWQKSCWNKTEIVWLEVPQPLFWKASLIDNSNNNNNKTQNRIELWPHCNEPSS